MENKKNREWQLYRTVQLWKSYLFWILKIQLYAIEDDKGIYTKLVPTYTIVVVVVLERRVRSYV